MNLLPDFVPMLGWALIDFLWQGAAVGLVAALLLALLRNARPQTRYALACVALALCMALPIASMLRSLLPAHEDIGLSQSFVASALALPGAPTLDSLTSWRTSLQAQLPWVVVAWSLGAGLLVLRMLLGCAWVSRISAQAGAVEASWQLRLDRLAASMKLQHAVRFRLAAELDGPVAAGFWRPVVLVPAAMIAGMPADLLEALLAHELAHVRRHDYLVNLLQSAVEALLFYHPVVWWLSRRIRIEREQIADDLALQAIGDPRRLALALQQLDRFQVGQASLLPTQFAPAAHGGNLMTRIQRLLRPKRHTLEWKLNLPVLGLALICLAAYAQGTPSTTGVRVKTEHQPYALVREGQDDMMVSGDTTDIVDIKRTREHMHGDFLWFRRDGTGYVVQDPGLLARARDAWQPAQAIGQKMDALSEQMQPHSDKMEALGKQMEALEQAGRPTSSQMQQTGNRMEPLARQQQELGENIRQLSEQMRNTRTEDQREQLDKKMRAEQEKMQLLQDQMQTLNDKLSRESEQLRTAQQPMEALGKQMQEASKPMEALGEKMSALGAIEEKLSHEADAKVKDLIDEAVRTGKAVPTKSVATL